jgi:hypothetical protein
MASRGISGEDYAVSRNALVVQTDDPRELVGLLDPE